MTKGLLNVLEKKKKHNQNNFHEKKLFSIKEKWKIC